MIRTANPRRPLPATSLLASLLAASPLSAQVVWIGPEIPVNTVTAGSQFAPAIASDAAGNFVVAWQGTDGDGSGFGVRARRFAADGTPATAELAVNATTGGDQVSPSVARLADGGFAVAWTSNGQDGSGFGIVVRRFNANGTPAGGEVAVNTSTAGNQVAPRIVANGSGFLVAWTGPGGDGSTNDVFARRFATSGAPATGELRMNSTVSGQQLTPAVAWLVDGTFVAAWASEGQDGSGYAVIARRFDANGAPLSAEIPVPTVTTLDQSEIGRAHV